MKDFFYNNKPFFRFLSVFFVVYGALFFVYQIYLSSFDKASNEPDLFTFVVTYQSAKLISFFGYNYFFERHPSEPSYKLLINNQYTVRVVEGCNALSLMILFVAFVVAFKGNWKSTLWFIFCGLLVSHLLNIFRIAIITIALYHYPEFNELLHGVVFPLIIYGTVFLLWIIWVKKFSQYAKN